MSELWQRFGLWLFQGIMPSPRPWWQLVMAIEKFQCELGEALGPAMNDVVDALEDFVEAIADMQDALAEMVEDA